MKLVNIFKKETKTPKVNIQKMDKKQLEKVVGGLEETTTTTKPDSRAIAMVHTAMF